MGRMDRSCTQSLLKTVNYALGMFGVAMILYALWMLKVWLRDRDSDHAQTPWFTHCTWPRGSHVPDYLFGPCCCGDC